MDGAFEHERFETSARPLATAKAGRRLKLGTDPIVVTRFDDVNALLKEPRVAAPPPPVALLRALKLVGMGSLARTVESGFLSLHNGVDHTRLRKVVEPFFHNRAVLPLDQMVSEVVERRLNTLDGQNEVDLVETVASKLPTDVIARIFGYATDDIPALNRWAHDLAPLGDGELHRSALLQGLGAFSKFRSLTLAEVKKRQFSPRDDLLSALALAHFGPLNLTEDEISGLAVLTFTAGHTTTAHLISSAAMLLYNNSALRTRLQTEPDTALRLVDETLRLYPPIQRVTRQATETFDFGGKLIRKGTLLRLKLADANRDPAQFTNPERCDLDRERTHSLAFASGPHFCFGNHLARMEADLLLKALIQRFPKATLVPGSLVWRSGTKFRGLSSLKLRLKG